MGNATAYLMLKCYSRNNCYLHMVSTINGIDFRQNILLRSLLCDQCPEWAKYVPLQTGAAVVAGSYAWHVQAAAPGMGTHSRHQIEFLKNSVSNIFPCSYLVILLMPPSCYSTIGSLQKIIVPKAKIWALYFKLSHFDKVLINHKFLIHVAAAFSIS